MHNSARGRARVSKGYDGEWLREVVSDFRSILNRYDPSDQLFDDLGDIMARLEKITDYYEPPAVPSGSHEEGRHKYWHPTLLRVVDDREIPYPDPKVEGQPHGRVCQVEGCGHGARWFYLSVKAEHGFVDLCSVHGAEAARTKLVGPSQLRLIQR